MFKRHTVRTSSASLIATYLAGTRGPRVFIVGGLQGRSLVDTPLGKVLLAAAGFGARVAMMELAGTGNSSFVRPPSMATLLEDILEVHRSTGHGRSIWIGASLGGWFTLLAHLREPQLFSSMCLLAPAINWDDSYVQPQLRSGQIVERDGVVDLLGFSLSMSLIRSMEGYRVGPSPLALKAPLHIIHGDQDGVAPIQISRQMGGLAGPLCSLEVLQGGDHGVAKLASQASRESLAKWLRARLEGSAA